MNLFGQVLPGFSENQKAQLLKVLLNGKRAADESPVLWILESLNQLPDSIAEQVGRWITEVEPKRYIQDKIEDIISIKAKNDDLIRRVARRAGAYEDEPSFPGIELLPRRLPKEAETEEPFLKYVPEGAPSKEHGLRVLILSDYNIAGQLTSLMRALNKYTNHMARCFIGRDDYLAYDKDIILYDKDGNIYEEALEETFDLIRRADFFHIGRGLINLPGLDWEKYISPRNAVFQYYGSHLRKNAEKITGFHSKSGFQAITAVDWTMYTLLPASFYHIQPFMLELDEMPSAEMDFSGSLRICHAPSNRRYRVLNKTDRIIEIMTLLSNENPRVDPVFIEGVENKECLEMKSRCHIHLNSLSRQMPGFGLNSIESAAIGIVPITPLDNFTRLLYPESPIVHADENSVYDIVKSLLSDTGRIKGLGQACREWARCEFDAKVLIKRYWYLYDLIYHGLSTEYPKIF